MSVVLACGGRNVANRDAVFATLDAVHFFQPVTLLLHGAARGADTLASEWAAARGVPQRAFPADWAAHGRGAGPRRNDEMLREGRPDLVVAFPGGAGTGDMVARAQMTGVRVLRIER